MPKVEIQRPIGLGEVTEDDHRKAQNLADLVRTYGELGGWHIQGNSVPTEQLKDAQLHPERHKDLQAWATKVATENKELRGAVTQVLQQQARQGQKEAPQQEPSPMAQAVARTGDSGKQKVRAGGSRKIGRNEPCPCGSGKKYKHCCGR